MKADQEQLYAKYYKSLYGDYLKENVECFLAVELKLSQDVYIVDLGCGPVIQLERLRTLLPNATLVGLDNSQAMLRAKSVKMDSALLAQCDITGTTAPTLPNLSSEQQLTLLCLGNTLALVSPSDYPKLARFVATLISQLGAASARLVIEVRDGDEYKRFIGSRRVELLAYSHSGDAEQTETSLSVQTLTLPTSPKSPETYSVQITYFHTHGKAAEYLRIDEPDAYFVDLEAFNEALKECFAPPVTPTPLSTKSGLKEGRLYKYDLQSPKGAT